MKLKYVFLLGASLVSIIFQPGCATTGKSIGSGAIAGAGVGAGIGALADPGSNGENRFRNVLIGSAAGGIIGAGTGYIIDRAVKDAKDDAYQKGKKDTQREISEHKASSDGIQPKLIPARTEARWVGDQVRGYTFVPGHFEYFIIEGARWDTSK